MKTTFVSHLNQEDQKKFFTFGVGKKVIVSDTRIHHSIEKFGKENPDVIAVEHLGRKITYQELLQKSEQVSKQLQQNGVKPGEYVGLFLERSIEMIIGILGILKSEAAYVPQDIRVTPTHQIQHMMKTAKIKTVLTLEKYKHLIPQNSETQCLSVEELLQTEVLKLEKPALPPKKDSPCFLLFTSGTTGLPNGVQVTHKNVCNLLLSSPGNLGIKPGMKVSQILNISFDMAAWEIFGALTKGATLVIRGKDFQETAEKVDVIIATPSILSRLDTKKLKHIQVAAVAGEPCPKPLADRWASFCTFYNSCGPTEVTIVNTMQHYTSQEPLLTIGKPTPNNTVYILDENLVPCEIGEIGEMWAGGDCVSLGYLGNEKLTQERYKPDPFLGNGQMMFRTRDLGRWTQDGQLEHFGRTDDQVKIKGFRVELDSVSNALESVSGCKQAVTIKLDSSTLVSFVKPSRVDLSDARFAVEKLLPYYATPKMIFSIDEFPTTSRGKIDKTMLTKIAVQEVEKLTSKSSEPYQEVRS